MNKDRKEKIQEWASKGAEWCATQLWTAREQAAKEREDKRRLRADLMKADFDRDAMFLLERANENMAAVLEESGIRPDRLVLTYLFADCDKCQKECGELSEPPCVFYDCDKEEIVTETVGLYTYFISGNGKLEGITSHFQLKNYNLLKAVDGRTGAVLYESSKGQKE